VKRALFVLAIAGCGPPDSIVVDGGVQDNVQLGVPPVATVVLGESASFDVSVTMFSASPNLTITTSPLPGGITCSSAVVTTNGSTHVTLSLQASADAAIAELPITIRATSGGKIVGSSPMLLDVSSVVGSLDPTFGDAGILSLPSGADAPMAISVVQDGTLVVAGFGAGRMFIERFAPTTTPGVPWQTGSSVTTTAGAVIASDGRVAFDMNDTSGETVTEVDATNTVILSDAAQGATALAWDGNDLFVATAFDVMRFSSSGNSQVTNAMTIESLETIAPGIALATGADASSTALLTTFTVNGATLDASPPIQITSDNVTATNTVTTAKGTLVGLAGPMSASVVRLDSQGGLLATYPLDASFARANEVVALSNGEPILLGNSQIQEGNSQAETGYVVGFDPAFGAVGHTYILDSATLVAGAIDATGQYLYVTGTMNGTSSYRGWVGRIRLTSSP
jgi:hypothetical protein